MKQRRTKPTKNEREREIWRNRTWEIAGKEGGVCCSCLLPLGVETVEDEMRLREKMN
jgi:hypothetical protein